MAPSVRLLFSGLIVAAVLACGRVEPSWPPVDRPGLQNYIRLSDDFVSGGEPKTEEAFAFLAAQGIRSILSVDGARTKVDLATQHGMTYLHTPIGYDALSEEEILQVVRALQDAPKPVYVHCHHGRHRGPTAAALGRIFHDGLTNDEAVAEMKRIGTAPKYTGLYETVQKFVEPMQFDVDAIGPIPASHEVTDIVQAMADLDRHWDEIKAARKRGWTNDPAHPDIAIEHEALQSAEILTEAHRLSENEGRDYLEWMAAARDAAWALQKALVRDDKVAAEAAYRKAGASCKDCHNKYRDD